MNSVVFWIAAYGTAAICASLLAGVLAGIRNRDYSFWMGWCFVFPPLVILLAALPQNAGPRPRRPSLDEEDRETW
ncbi:MAG: hypothetical protein NW217_09045 [Hyphomicrobiaceae bacterium]|nr:hypothetical protein [Hyphomicrobiaceae bacterium]